MKRTISGKQLLTIKPDLITLDEGWHECLGDIPRHCVVFVWGQSGNGKTGAMMSFAKALTNLKQYS